MSKVKYLITKEEVEQTKKVILTLLQVITEHPESFKKEVLKLRYPEEIYYVNNVHLNAWRSKVELKFHEDNSTTHVYVEIEDIFNWYQKLGKMSNKELKCLR